MKSKRLLLMLLLALLVPWAASAQDRPVITIGEGTSTQSYPLPGYYGWNYDVFLYTPTAAAALGVDCEIYSIGFNVSSNSTSTGAQMTIWVKDVDADYALAAETTFADYTTDATQVYETDDLSSTAGWNTFSFSSTFTHEGGKALLVAVRGVGCSTSGGCSRSCYYTTESNTYWYKRKDSTDPGTNVTGSVGSNRANIRLEIVYTGTVCIAPSGLAASNITDNSATLSWEENGEATEWILQYGTDNTFATNTEVTVSTNPTKDLTGLTALTTYYARVKPDCDTDGTHWSTTLSFNTTAVAEAVGDSWSDDFEGASCSWDLVNGELTNAWVWGTAANNGGTHGLYISNDNGTSNAYSHSATIVYATKLLNFTEGKFEFAYDWKANGESSYDYLRVALVPASVTLTAGTTPSGFSSSGLPTGWIALDGGSKLNLVTAWQSKSLAINVTAGNYYLVMAWKNDGGGGTQPPATVDNMSITRVACGYDVEGLAVTEGSITTTGAAITWTAGDPGQWQVAIKEGSDEWDIFPTAVSSNAYTLTGLNPATNYQVKVRAYCGGEDYGSWCNAISFTTECDVIPALGYTENFDGYTVASASTPSARVLPNCWGAINTTTNNTYKYYPTIYYYSYTNYANSTPNCLRFYSYYSSYSNYDPQDQYAILPEMSDLAGKQITLQVRGYNDNSTFKIGTMSDPTDVTTFKEIATQDGLTTSYQEFFYIIPAGTTDAYVAIMIEAATSTRTYNGIYVDDIVIDEAPACPKPTSLAVNGSGQSATLTWESEGAAWDVAHALSATANPDESVVAVEIDTKTYTMDDLAIGEDHYFWVRSNCDRYIQSEWKGPVSVHIGYCVPNPSSRDGKGITKVNFGTGDYIVNNVDETNGLPATSPYYGDYSSMVGAMQAGVESTISITYATGSSTVYSYGTIIWVDWDNSLSFEDSEIVYTGTSVQGTGGVPQVLDATFTIPADQATGEYRMRIAGADSYFDSYIGGTATGNHSACFSSTYAVCHDYTLRVLEAPSCLLPTGLAATTDGETATATWDGTATSYNIDINGTVTNNVTSPYTFPVELSTTYTVKVQANCPGDETSDWTNPVSFTTPACLGGHTIEYTLTDSYNDSWNGATITVVEGCGNIVETITCESGASPFSGSLTLCGDYYEFIWNSGNYDNECNFTFTEGGTTLFTKPSSLSDGQVLYTIGTQSMAKPTDLTAGTPDTDNVELSWTENGAATAWQICVNGDEDNLVAADRNPFVLEGLTPDTDYTVKVRSTDGSEQSCWSDEVSFTTAISCNRPENLAESNLTTNSVTLSWEGTNDSYVLEYRPWYPAGDDIIATGTMTTYTVDLSGFTGTGSVAIRHYDVTDMFQLIVDDIQVVNAANEVVFSEDFESCGGNVPAAFTNMDLDGDGYEWGIAQSPSSNVNGTYGIVSESWISGVGALTPDNWLIISGIEMGGQMTFQARGQDPSFPYENFAIYVSTEASIVEVPLTATTYNVTGLIPNTPYAWQVKGICGSEESRFVSSFFKTKDDILVFATAGNWNTLSNWTDADGAAITALPTTENNVRIDAAAEVPASYVAEANKITLNGGAITLKDGAQIKHNSATLWVNLEKEIAGFVDETTNNGGYYFISTPFSGNTQIVTTPGTWSYVLNLTTDDYDLYAFDATSNLEWINYKNNPTHSEFTAGSNNGLIFKRGYLYASKADRTLNFAGTISKTINNSMVDEYTYDATSTAEWNGWKLVGNPFACNAYLNYVDAEDNVLAADFYVMNTAGDGYQLSSSNVGLAPLTGAFINYSATGKVQFSTEVPSGTQVYANLTMTVSQNRSTVDMARVRFGNGFNLGKVSFRENSTQLYIPQDGKDYAVVNAGNVGEMPVNFKTNENGTYTLSFNSENVTFSYLHLIDNMTGADVDLLETPSYSFDARYTDYASRFRLVFATGSSIDGDSFGYVNGNGNLSIFGIEGEATVQVIDMLGHILSSETFSGSYEKQLNAAPGVYMIRLINGNDVKVQKIVIK